EPDRQGVDLLFELGEPASQAVALVAEGLGEGNHRFDQSLLTRLGRGDVTQRRHVAHRGASRNGSRRSEQLECRLATRFDAYFQNGACRAPDSVTSVAFEVARLASVARIPRPC